VRVSASVTSANLEEGLRGKKGGKEGPSTAPICRRGGKEGCAKLAPCIRSLISEGLKKKDGT